jgi:hypothetical protein
MSADNLNLTVVCKGEVVSSNLPAFREAVTLFVSGVNRSLTTDAQFGQAKDDVKLLQTVEERIKAAKEKALRDAEQLHALFSELDESSEEVRAARLDLQKQIERQEKSVKAQLVADAINKLECAPHLRLKAFGSTVELSIKGKRTIDSMTKALNIIVGSLNVQINATKSVIAEWEETNGERVPDSDQLELETAETVRLKLQARTNERKATEERKRMQDEQERERKRLADEIANERAERLKAEAQTQAAAPVAKQAAERPPVVIAPLVESAPVATPAPRESFALSAEESEEEELARFRALIRNAFAPVKAAREALKYPQNILLAKEFASIVRVAFVGMEKGGKA